MDIVDEQHLLRPRVVHHRRVPLVKPELEVLTWDDLAAEPEPVKPGSRPGIQCLCGRFARWAGDRHYYNGTFNCYSYDVQCSRCGVVTIECV